MDNTETGTRRFADETGDHRNEPKQVRERSQIKFPYTDLGQAEELARKLFERGGGVAEPAQLAVWLDQSATGGTFRSRLSAAHMFGFIESDRNSVRLTDSGRDVLDPDKTCSVRTEAFLHVPLFQAMYDKNNGRTLPPAAALERQMMDLGVPTKQKGRARQVFQKSATVAQFVDQDSGRFTKPADSSLTTTDDRSDEKPEKDNEPRGSGGDGPSDHHPFVAGLLSELPKREDYLKWCVGDQAEWLRAAASIFKLLSKQPGRIKVDIENAVPGSGAGEAKVAGGTYIPSAQD